MSRAHRQEIRVPGMPEPISHFTHVVRAGRLVFVSGCVASDAEGRTVGGMDVVAPDVCKVTVFLKDVADREKVNTVRREYFGAHRPASTLLEISRLVRDDLLIEIECIAVLPERTPVRAKARRPKAARAPKRRGRAR